MSHANVGEGETVVICGSLRFLEQMREWKARLEARGYKVLTPTLVDFHAVRDVEGDLGKFVEVKRRETRNHFGKVELADVLLVLNYEKDGRQNYIGGNTFAEIAVAVYLNLCKGRNIRIYTVNPLPVDASFYEELHAWGVRQWDHG